MIEQKNKLKVMCVSHAKDVDGCVSASIIKMATNSKFLLTNYGGINKSLKRIKNVYDIVYICDLGINDTIIEELERVRSFSELVYIDHHHVDESLLTQLKEMGVEIIHDLRDCASVLTFNLFQEHIPREAGLLACYGAYSDRLENGHLAKEIIQKFDRDFVLFETMLLTYALDRADLNLRKKIVKSLSNLEYPHNIDNVTTHALNQVNRIAELRKEISTKSSTYGKIAYMESKDDSTSVIANLLLDVCEADIGLSYKISSKKISDISLRSKNSLKIHLGKITSHLSTQMDGIGGGHPHASGARIPTTKLKEFIHALKNNLDKNNNTGDEY